MKKCKVCRQPFEATRPMQMVCSGTCGLAYARSQRVKAQEKERRADRVEKRAKLAALMPLSYWVKIAQSAFNAWVRERDRFLPCISCGGWKSSWDAGHYLTTGARPELRFDPHNVHKQCVQCNQHLHGNTAAMRLSMIGRIGLEAVERLEGPHPPKKYTADELKAMAADYRARTRELQRARSTCTRARSTS